jgi:hypothetical protein
VVLPYHLFHVEKHICLSHDVYVTGVAWRAETRIEVRVGGLGVEDRGWSSTGRVLSGWRIKRSGDDVCGLHHAQVDEERGFLSSASKPRSIVSPGLASKPVATVHVVWPPIHSLRFPSSGLKIGSCG